MLHAIVGIQRHPALTTPVRSTPTYPPGSPLRDPFWAGSTRFPAADQPGLTPPPRCRARKGLLTRQEPPTKLTPGSAKLVVGSPTVGIGV